MLPIHTYVAEEGRCICACREIVDLPAVFTGCNLTDGKRRSEGNVDITTEQSLFETGVPPCYAGQFHEERLAKRFSINFTPAEKLVWLSIWLSGSVLRCFVVV